MADFNSSFLTSTLRSSVNISLIASIFCMPAFAETKEDDIGFANEQICAVPRIELPEPLLKARESAMQKSAALEAERRQQEQSFGGEDDASKILQDGQQQDTQISQDEVSPEPIEEEIELEADNLELAAEDNVILTGNAHVIQGQRGVFADEIIYNKSTYKAKVMGNVHYYTIAGDELITDSMRMEIDTFIGETGQAKMRLADRTPIYKQKSYNYVEDFTIFAPFRTRIIEQTEGLEEVDNNPRVSNRVTADKIEIEGVDLQRLHNATITRCPTGEDVLISGKEVELDHIAGVGYAKHVTIKFKGVPILYTPRFSFPLNDERKTGFLAPSFGDDDVSGGIVSIPYYFNISPQADATLRTTHYANRGVQFFGEFRYLNEFGNASLRAEWTPEDELRNNDSRSAFGLDVSQNYSNGWGIQVDLQDVSDTNYLSDFKNDINLTSSTHLPQTLSTRYNGNSLYLRARTSKYVAVTPDLESSKPYDRLPQVEFGINEKRLGIFRLGLDAEYISYEHDQETRLTGSRLNVKPYISMPIEPVYGYVKPKVSFRSINYSLENVELGAQTDPSVAAPIFSVDSGIYLERETAWGGKALLHTLEPRAMYVYVPAEDHTDAPVFDTGSGSVSSYGVLFREERFFGGDRIGDDQHISVGVTSRIIDDEDGSELLNASIGQLFYLDDREVNLKNDGELDTSTESDIFAQLTANFTDEVKFNTFVRWNAKDNELRNTNIGIEYKNGLRRLAAIDYSKTTDRSEDVRLRLDWPLAPKIQAQVDHRYSIEDSESRTRTLGLVYDGCCWALGLKTSKYFQRQGEERETFLLTLELDGLGSVSTAQ